MRDGDRSAGLGGPVGGRDRALGDPAARRVRNIDRVAADQPRRPRRQRRRSDPRLHRFRRRLSVAAAVRRDRLRSPRRGRVDRGHLPGRRGNGLLPLRHPVRPPRVRRMDRGARAVERGLLRRVRGEQRRHPAVHHDRELRSRHGPHARGAGRQAAELPRLLVRDVPRRDLREALSRAGRAIGAGRGDRSGGVGCRRQHDPGDRFRVGPARLHGRLPEPVRLPVQRHGR